MLEYHISILIICLLVRNNIASFVAAPPITTYSAAYATALPYDYSAIAAPSHYSKYAAYAYATPLTSAVPAWTPYTPYGASVGYKIAAAPFTPYLKYGRHINPLAFGYAAAPAPVEFTKYYGASTDDVAASYSYADPLAYDYNPYGSFDAYADTSASPHTYKLKTAIAK